MIRVVYSPACEESVHEPELGQIVRENVRIENAGIDRLDRDSGVVFDEVVLLLYQGI